MYEWLEPRDPLILQTIKHISLFAQWLKHVHGKHEFLGSNPTLANFLYGIKTPWLKMNTRYIGKFHFKTIITSQIKFDTLK